LWSFALSTLAGHHIRNVNENSFMTSICVFCGASPGRDPKHMALASAVGKALADGEHRLVYGGGGLGLMGAVARSTHKEGGKVLGIMPEFLTDVEKTLTDVEHILVPDMHARKIMMYDESEAFIVLPGGIGTLEETIEILSWMRLNLHEKPLVFLDDTGYWDPIIRGLHHTIEEGFAPESFAKDIHSASTAHEALALIADKIANPNKREPLNIHNKV